MKSKNGQGAYLLAKICMGALLSTAVITASPALAADTWVEPLTGIEFVKVAGGCFTMGQRQSDRDELELIHGAEFYAINFADELPAHEVCLAPFSISRHEITVAEYRKFMFDGEHINDSDNTGGCYQFNSVVYRWRKNGDRSWDNPGFKQTDQHPVVCVSWNDGHSFAEWLTKKQTGMAFAMPSEAQWEFAARAGNDIMYAGEGSLTDLAWNVDNSKKTTHPVGTKKANANNLTDMSGNVWEWVQDWYDPTYQNSSKDDPGGQVKGIYKTLRGGGWNSFAHNCRIANREKADPSHADTNLGFRLVARP